MTKKIFSILFPLLLLLTSSFGCFGSNTERTFSTIEIPPTFYQKSETGTENMTLTTAQLHFESFFTNISTIPVSFVYANKYYKGFGGFKILSQTTNTKNGKSLLTLKLAHPDKILVATIEATMFNNYDAYEWTVYFENVGANNSSVIESLSAADFIFNGNNPVIKNNLGDYGGHFAPVSYPLEEKPLIFNANTGRSTEELMPYFNLETDNGGLMMAIGWSGTWNAEFNKLTDGVSVKATGTVGLKTYLKPGEKIRTARMAFVSYDQRDEALATNKWRRWMIYCNMPRENTLSDKPVQPASIVGFVSDTEWGWYRGGSGDENFNTWKKSYESLLKRNLKFDYHWFDAGWYESPAGSSLAGNDWAPVGSWTIDTVKWPENSLNQYLSAVHTNIAKNGSVMWFEIERFRGNIAEMKRAGADPNWFLPEYGQNFVLNLGNEDARNWIFNKIITALSSAGANIYRQDHNFSPSSAFSTGDLEQGPNRIGITENLHFQGEYELWQKIIDWQIKTGRPSFIEGQSAGGNRQDIEVLKYMVSFFRSDSDITLDPSSAISKVNALNKWIPFGGVIFGQLSEHPGTNDRNKFQWRSTYSSTQCLSLQYQNLTQETWDLVEWGLQEFNRYKTYTYYDFYELTPWKPLYKNDQWTARMYFDEVTDKGVLEVFNFAKTNENKTVVKLKGVNPNHWYSLTDPDNTNGIRIIKGQELINGYEIYLTPESSCILWINPVDI